jgi:predicted nucleotidyltransferase
MRTKKKPDRRKNGRCTSPSQLGVNWSWSKNGKPDPAILADIVKRIVRAAQPEKIVLFGSAARGEMGPNSDYDLLVIKGGKYNHWRQLTTIHKHLSGKEAPVDVVLVTPEDVERYRDAFCLVICPALEEGKVVYDSKASTARRSARMAKSSTQQPGPRQVARARRVS